MKVGAAGGTPPPRFRASLPAACHPRPAVPHAVDSYAPDPYALDSYASSVPYAVERGSGSRSGNGAGRPGGVPPNAAGRRGAGRGRKPAEAERNATATAREKAEGKKAEGKEFLLLATLNV